MLVPSILLGVLPSLNNAFISAVVGYLTEVTNAACTFYKALLSLYLMGALANYIQYRADTHFDAKFRARDVNAVRIFVPAIAMSVVLLALGELLAYSGSLDFVSFSMKMGIFAVIGLAGFCAGCLSGVGAVVGGSVGEKQSVMVWIGISSAGVMCVATVYIVGFSPEASATCVRLFFLVASVLVMLCTVALGVSHAHGDMDEAYERAADEGVPIIGETSDEKNDWLPWLQGINTWLSVFCFPLLPLLCSSALAQELVLWKLVMDFVAPVALLALPKVYPMVALGLMTVTRCAVLAVVLWLLIGVVGPTTCPDISVRSRISLVGSWDVLMLLGAFISAACDAGTQGSPGHPQTPRRMRPQLLRRNRMAHNMGICIGLLSSGSLMYMLQGPVDPDSLRNQRSSIPETLSCPTCVKPDPERAALKTFPCGLQSDKEQPWLWLFSYGANMGCKKLSALGVQPQSAQAAYIPGQCLRFGAAAGVPTSDTEPAFGNLVPCTEGCVHGVLQKISKSQISKIDVTEPGYGLTEMPDVIGYNGERITGVKAYVMQKKFTVSPPSRRYAGLVYCTAKEELAGAYAEKLSCELGNHGIHNMSCGAESFKPLAARFFFF